MTRKDLTNLLPGDEKELLGVCNWEQSDLVVVFFNNKKDHVYTSITSANTSHYSKFI